LIALREVRSRQALGRAAIASFALHAGVLAALLIVVDRAGRDVHEGIDKTPMVELVMVEQKGRGPTEATPPPPPDRAEKPVPAVPSAAIPPAPPPVPPAPQPPAPQPSAPQPSAPQPPAANSTPVPPPPPTPPATDAAVALPPPPTPVPPVADAAPTASPPPPVAAPPTTAPQAPQQLAAQAAIPRLPRFAPPSPTPPQPETDATPRINLGGTDSLSNILVQGDDVIPAGVDSKVHNREPIYPDEAVRHGEQGAVILLIQVSPDGLASGVDIARSSGFNSLDRAARDAVATWRFLPAVRDGQPVASSMSMRIVFRLD
jgi:protein TonB